MLPISLNIAMHKVVVIGRGMSGARRYELVHAAGAERIHLFAIDQDGWACHAEALVHERLPDSSDFADARIVFIAGLPEETSSSLRDLAKSAGALVNVEDAPQLCDFHVPSIVRRGGVVVAVSTSGQAPGLARRLRQYIEDLIGVEWDARLKWLAAERKKWRDAGQSKTDIAHRTTQIIDQHDWLPKRVSQ